MADATAATERVLSAYGTAHRHIVSEQTNDVDQVMATVSRRVCYLVPDVTSLATDLLVLTEREDVRQYYLHERSFMERASSTLLAELTSDWYTFLETRAITRQVATGTLHQNDVVVLIPVAEDGIVGEVLITRRPWLDVYSGTAGPLPGRPPEGDATAWRSRAMKSHETFLDGLRAGQPEDAAAAFRNNAQVAVVDLASPPFGALAGVGLEAAIRRCAMVLDALADPEVLLLNRIIGDWYVFAEWLVRGTARSDRIYGVGEGQKVEVRNASIFGVGDDRLLAGEQGFSVIRAVE